MSKWLVSEFEGTINSAVDETFVGLNSNVYIPIVEEWCTMGLHLIYDSDIDRTTVGQLLDTSVKRLLQPIVNKYKSVYNDDGGISELLTPDKVDKRTVNVDRSSADEYQPINASIDEITSPTSKMKSVAGGTDTNTETGVDVFDKYTKIIDGLDTLNDLIRKQLSPLIDEFNIMY